VVAVPLDIPIRQHACLHVPSIGVGLGLTRHHRPRYLRRVQPTTRLDGLAALDKSGAEPDAVIAGHKRAQNDDTQIIETRLHRDFRTRSRDANDRARAIRYMFKLSSEPHPRRSLEVRRAVSSHGEELLP